MSDRAPTGDPKQREDARDKPVPDIASKITGKEIFTYPQAMFTYHAGQRMNSIRYFTTALGIIVGAYGTIVSSAALENPDLLAFVVCLFSVLITSVFWALDIRNERLVHIDEDCLRELERAVQKELTGNAAGEEVSTRAHWYQITKRADDQRGWLNYYHVMRGFFVVVMAGSLYGAYLHHAGAFPAPTTDAAQGAADSPASGN